MLSLIAAVFTVASVYLAGRKNIWAWPLGFVGASLWVVFALGIGDAGVLLMNAFFCALYVWNFVSWKGFTMPVFIGREARIRRAVSRIKRAVRSSDEEAEAHRRLQPWLAQRFGLESEPLPGVSPTGCDFQEVEPSPYLEKQALEDCKTCGCLLSSERTRPVAVAIYDLAFQIAREGRNLPPYENLVHDIRYDFFCKRDRPPYDRVVYVPQVNGETIREFFVKVYGGDGMTPDSWRQVTEEGEQYD